MSDVHSELANVRHTCGHCCHDTSFPKLLSDVRVQVSDCIVLTERAMQGERIDAIHTKNTTKEKREKKRCLLTDLDPYIQPIFFNNSHGRAVPPIYSLANRVLLGITSKAYNSKT